MMPQGPLRLSTLENQILRRSTGRTKTKHISDENVYTALIYLLWQSPERSKIKVLPKTKHFVFWHIAEITARYHRQNDPTGVAPLFGFHKIKK